MEVDHINGDGLDNQRSNLRLATKAENNQNKGPRADNTSGYKGVTWYKRDKKWKAQIHVDMRNLHLGYFNDIVEAALAYDKAALEYFGEFARTNF